MKYFAVIDTNILVSSMIRTNSIPSKIIDMVKDGTIVPIINEEILKEYNDVLFRKKFVFDLVIVNKMLSEIKRRVLIVDKIDTNEIFIDDDDKVFYQVLMSARQKLDVYLITGNKKHFPERDYIVSPREMLDIIEKELLINNQ